MRSKRVTVPSEWAAMLGANDESVPVHHAQRVRAAWDEARGVLESSGLPVTFETVCAIVAAGDGIPARHARGWITRELARGAR